MRIKPNALHAAFVVLTIVSANALAVDVTAGDGSTVHDRYGAAVTDRYNAPAQTAPAGDDAAVPSQAAAPAQPEATTHAKQEKARARAAQGPYEVDGETLFEFNSTPFDVPATR